MADKAISELISADLITASDNFVLEQSGTAKKLTGQVLLNWLTKAADGHGGISSITKTGTSGLEDKYRITLADTTIFDFRVANGNGVSSLVKRSTSGLNDTWRMTYNDGSYTDMVITNGAKGNPGEKSTIYIKWASQEPTASSHSFGDIPDNWMGVYAGYATTAPTDWTQYKWYEIKGAKGNTGSPSQITSQKIEYQASDSGTVVPSGNWSTAVPTVAQGRYLWTRTTIQWNSGSPQVSYSVGRMGRDGTGTVSTVAGQTPDRNGNVELEAENVGAVDTRDVVTDEEIERLFKSAETIAQELYKISPSVILEALGGYQNVHVTPFPVGAVYISVTLISPSEVFGGTWERIEDRFLLAAGTKYAAGATGGEWEHTLTVDEIPSHGNHIPQKPIGTGGAAGKYLDVSKLSTYGSSGHGWTLYGGNEAYPYGYEIGGSQPHNITPPFLAVYVWKRVA